VSAYFLLTVGLSVLVFLVPAPDEGTLLGLLFLATILPTAVAIGLTWVIDGRSGAAAFIRQCFQWRSPLVWYVAAVAIGFVVQFGASVLALLFGQISALQLRPPLPILIAFILFALLEEIGWRGFALRQLLTQLSPFSATLIIGFAWGGVHFVLALVALEVSPVAEFMSVFALSFSLTWIFVRSGGSVLVATVAHFSLNAFGSVVGPALSMSSEADAVWFFAASGWIVATILVVADRRMWFGSPSGLPVAAAVRP
jgi:membrane protease YdiL (CAAX protease family)